MALGVGPSDLFNAQNSGGASPARPEVAPPEIYDLLLGLLLALGSIDCESEAIRKELL